MKTAPVGVVFYDLSFPEYAEIAVSLCRYNPRCRKLRVRDSITYPIPLSSIKSFADLMFGSRALMSLSALCFWMAGSMIAGFSALISVSIELYDSVSNTQLYFFCRSTIIAKGCSPS